VEKVFDSGGLVFVVMLNNYGQSVAELVTEGELVYLFDLHELNGAPVSDIKCTREGKRLHIAVEYSSETAPDGPSLQISRDVFRGSVFPQ
jgi:hypothetical protein